MAGKLYAYEVRDKAGNALTGQMQAGSPQLVAQQLRDQGYIIVRITEQQAESERTAVRRPTSTKVPPTILAQFYRQFATTISSGMSVIQALHVLEDTIGHTALRWALRGILRGVERGQRLSDNMARFPEVFSPLAVAVVRAGEHGGRLEEMLAVLADYAERDQEVRRMISRETFYPKILLFALLTIVPGGLTVAIVISQGLGAGLRWVAPILGAYALFLVLAIIGYYLVRVYGSSQQGRLVIDRFKLSLPIFGALVNRIAMSRFCRAMSALYSAGVPIPQAVRLAGQATGNAAMSEVVESTVPHLERGGTLSDALAQFRLIPDLVVSMLRTGEQTGNIDQTLQKVADYYDDETRTKIHQLGQTIVPICVILAAIVVLIIAVLFFTNLYSSIFSAAAG